MTAIRYGSSLYEYGIPLMYGQESAVGLLLWGVEVDWDDDGIFDGSNEAARMIGFNSFRGRRQMFKKNGEGFETIQPGKFTIVLNNYDRRYDEFNTSSPLYPNIGAGRDVRISVVDASTLTRYAVVYGIIEDVVPSYYKGDYITKIFCTDTSVYLTKNNARVAVTPDISPEDAMGLVLDDVAWPSRWGRSLDTTPDVIPFYWSLSKRSAYLELNDLSDSHVGYFFSAADGSARYVGRGNSQSVVDTYDQSILLSDLGISTLYDNYRNLLRVKIHPRIVGSTDVVWEWVGATRPAIPSSGTEQIWGDYDYNGLPTPAKDVVTPVATTDYIFNTLEDGSGVDKTADVTVTLTDFGDSCKLVISSAYAGGPVYATKLQVRGKPVYEENTSDLTYPRDISVVANPRIAVLDLGKMQSSLTARGIADVLGAFLATRNPTPVVQVESRPAVQFLPDLFNVVTVDIPKLGLSSVSMRVAGIQHESLVESCQAIRTIFYLEPYVNGSGYWTWPVTDFGTDTIFSW